VNKKNSKLIVFAELFETFVNVIRFKIMVTNRKEENAGCFAYNVIWDLEKDDRR
jgi:hypothetical protein